MKKVFQVKGTEGKSFRRTTERDYTHAVVCMEAGAPRCAISFCGSRELADKARRQYERYYEYPHNGKNLEIREVERIK